MSVKTARLDGKSVLVIGRPSGIAGAIVSATLDAGAMRGASNPERRIGTVEDIASGVVFALTNTFLTGTTLHIDGGEPLT